MRTSIQVEDTVEFEFLQNRICRPLFGHFHRK